MDAVKAKQKADQDYAANLKAEFVYSEDEVMRPTGLFWVDGEPILRSKGLGVEEEVPYVPKYPLVEEEMKRTKLKRGQSQGQGQGQGRRPGTGTQTPSSSSKRQQKQQQQQQQQQHSQVGSRHSVKSLRFPQNKMQSSRLRSPGIINRGLNFDNSKPHVSILVYLSLYLIHAHIHPKTNSNLIHLLKVKFYKDILK